MAANEEYGAVSLYDLELLSAVNMFSNILFTPSSFVRCRTLG